LTWWVNLGIKIWGIINYLVIWINTKVRKSSGLKFNLNSPIKQPREVLGIPGLLKIKAPFIPNPNYQGWKVIRNWKPTFKEGGKEETSFF